MKIALVSRIGDKKRRSKQRQAVFFRYLIAIVTFFGVGFPVLDVFTDCIFGIYSDQFAKVGHSLLIIAAILYGVKNYFGSTNGHIRYAKTQLKLEEIVSLHTILYANTSLKIKEQLSETDKEELQKIPAQMIIDSFKEILGETNQWGKDILNDESQFIGKYVKSEDDKNKDKSSKKDDDKNQGAN